MLELEGKILCFDCGTDTGLYEANDAEQSILCKRCYNNRVLEIENQTKEGRENETLH